MTHKENIRAILECYFAGFKEEIIDNACDRIVKLEPKTGHWIKVHPLQADDEGAYMCSCCEVGDWNLEGTENYCPNCGAKMESEGQK